MKIDFRFNYGMIAVVALLLHCSACTKFVEVEPPTTQADASLIFENDAAAISAVTGLYSRMTQANLLISSGAMTLYPGLSADEFYHTVTSPDMDQFLNNSLIPDNGTGNNNRLWKAGYQTIYQANAILEGLEQSSTLTDTVKAVLKGEALVVRSLSYFYLVNLYGATPFTTKTDYRINQSLPRTSVSEVYQHLVSDLLQAKSLMKTSYPTINRARPNRHTATALLARIYLYTKDWAKAATEATEVIQSGSYSLVTVLNNVFIPSSNEIIWQLAKDNGNTGEGFTFVPASATVKPGYAITNHLLNAFETADKRKVNWLAKNTVTGVEYYYPFKYKVRVTTPVTEHYVVFRLAEQYLIRSEARAMLNDLPGSKGDLDIVRSRAGLTGTPALTQAALITAIERERQGELFLEWGHRWLDLKRWGRADAVIGLVKGTNWQSTDMLYPIPLREVQTNLSLVQNPGY